MSCIAVFPRCSCLGQGLATRWAAQLLALAGPRAALARMLHMKEGARLDVEVGAAMGERLDLAGFGQQKLHRHVIPGRPHLESRSLMRLAICLTTLLFQTQPGLLLTDC